MKYIITEAQLSEIVHNTINKILLSESKQNKQYKELLLEGDDRLKKVKKIIQQAFSGTALNTDGPVSSAEYYVGNKGANTTWMDYLLYSVRHTFGLMENKDLPLLVKVAKIAFDELEFEKSENHIDELNTLKAIVNLLKKDTNAANRVIKDPNVTYEKLYNEYDDILKQLENDMRYRVNSKEYQKNQRYEIMPIDDFRTANEFGKYTGTGNGDGALCYTQGKNTWDGYTRKGDCQCYLCYTKNFKDIEPIVTEGYPKDEYGLSMIWLFVNGDGELANSNVRWNHGNRDFKNVDNMFTSEEISDIVGVNFYETFRPNDKWAKKLEEALYRLKNGEDPSDVFDNCYEFSNGFARVELNRRYNHINTNGEIVSPNMWFDECWNFYEGFARVQLNNKWNYLKTNGELVSPNRWFDRLDYFRQGFAMVESNNKYNFINTNGELVSPKQWFDWCEYFKNGFARVQLGNSWYFINADGNIVNDAVQQMLTQGIPLDGIFDECGEFKEGFAWVRVLNKWNYINTNGELVSPNRWFEYCKNFKGDFAVVELNNKYNYINTNGDCISDTWFDECWDFKEGFATVQLGEQYNFINANGELLSPNQWFDACGDFFEVAAAVSLGDKWNFINANGIYLSDTWFDWCGDFKGGFAAVRLDNSWHFINADGDIINDAVQQMLAQGIPLDGIFDSCYEFCEGFAKVRLGNKWNYVNANGELLSPNRWFDKCYEFKDGFGTVNLNEKYNFINANGEFLSPNQWFDTCGNFYEGVAIVTVGNRYYRIDTKGQLYTMDGDPINSPLQENYRYRKNKKQVIKITESQLRNAIGNVVKDFYLFS